MLLMLLKGLVSPTGPLNTQKSTIFLYNDRDVRLRIGL